MVVTGGPPSEKHIDLRRLVDALPDLIWMMHSDGRFEFVNHRWCDYTGQSADQALGHGWQSAVHCDDIANIQPTLTGTSSPCEFEARLRRHDGEYRWFLLRLAPLNDADGSARSWCGRAVYSDEKAAEAPGGPDVRLKRFVDTMPTQVVFMTPELELEYINREVEAFFDKPLEALKKWASSGNIHHPDDLPSIFERLTQLRSEGGAWENQSRMLRADGVYRWIKSRMVPSTDAQGNIVRYVSCQTDVDDLKRAEDLLAGEVRLLEMVVDGQPLAAILDALSRLVEQMSVDAFCSILLVAPDQKHFRVGAGPSLPQAYNEVLDGKTIDGGYGPCSLSILRKQPIITANIANDPRWEGSTWPPLMKSYGYASCWSMPIMSGSGDISGIFAIYRRDPVTPTAEEQELIDRFTKIAGIAIDRTRADEALRAREVELRQAHAHLTQAQRLSHTGSFTTDLDADEHLWSDELYRILGIEAGGRAHLAAFRALVHPDDLLEFDSGYRQALTNNSDFDHVFRIVTPKGEIKHLHAVSHFSDSVDGRRLIMGSVQDITQRAATEQALKAREAELRRALEQLAEGQRLSSTGSFTADIQRDEHSWSDEYYRIFEIDRETHPSVNAVRERVHPDDLELFDYELQRAMEGSDADFIFRIVTPTKGVRHLRGVARVIDHIEGRPIFMGTVQDITESKAAEAALTASEADLRQAYDYLTEAQRLSKTGSFTWDVLADEHNWSDEIRRLFGFDPGVTVTMSMIQAAIHPDDMAEVERVIGGAAQGNDFDLVFRIVRAGGEVRYAHVVGRRMEQIQDRPVFLGALQDVTENKTAEAALRASEADLKRANHYLTTAQRLSKTGSFTWDLETEERQWSPEMYRIFDVDPASTVPSPMSFEFVHPDDRPILENLLQTARDGRDFEGEFRLLTPGGNVKNLHVTGNLLNGDRNKPVFVGAAQDVTELKRGEEALSKARAELAHVARVTTLSAMTASIAHEVSQPLSGILTNASTCLRLLAADPPDLSGAAETARRTIRDSNRANEVIKRLRALFARRAPVMESVDLNEAAQEVIALSSGELGRSRVVVHVDLAEDLPAVSGDRIQLQQVILNLILNAADAMSEIEDRPRSMRVQTRLDRDGGVIVSVQDAGIGIDGEAMAKLFDTFYTTKDKGMGVGLSISRSIIESHSGHIWAQANDGPGATFSFSLPPGSTVAEGGAESLIKAP